MLIRFSASKYCFALVGTFISLLWITSPQKEEADLYKSHLDEYRWILRLSSRSAEFLERAINMLATSTGVLMKEMSERPDPALVLTRYLRRATLNSAQIQIQADPISQSSTYQSESEIHDDTSSENTYDETPSEIGVLNREWNMEESWFAGTANSADHVFGASGDPSAYFQSMPEFVAAVTE